MIDAEPPADAVKRSATEILLFAALAAELTRDPDFGDRILGSLDAELGRSMAEGRSDVWPKASVALRAEIARQIEAVREAQDMFMKGVSRP